VLLTYPITRWHKRKGTRSRVPHALTQPPTFWPERSRRPECRYFAVALVCIILPVASCNKATSHTAITTSPKVTVPNPIVQAPFTPISVAEALKQTDIAVSNPISVKGHFWWGKEGSMIYDSYYKAILKLQYSDAFNAKHPDLDFFLPVPRRKSNLATVTGRLSHAADGKLVLIADDVQFSENPR